MIEQAKRGMVAALNCIFSFAYTLTQQSVLEQIAKNSVYNWNIGNQGDEVFSLISQLFQVEPVVCISREYKQTRERSIHPQTECFFFCSNE